MGPHEGATSESLDGVVVERFTRSKAAGAAEAKLPKPPQGKGRRDPNYRATLVQRETLNVLRKLQKSAGSRVNLKYFSEACVRIALDRDRGEIVRVAELLSRE